MADWTGKMVVEKLPMRISSLVKPSVADDTLQRPDWTESSGRGNNLLWLDKNENSDPHLSEVVMEVFRSIDKRSLYGYPNTFELYEKLAGHLGIEMNNLLLSHGSDGVIRSLFDAFVSNGEKVMITSPTFVMYEIYAKMYGAKLIKVDYYPSPDGPVLEASRLIEAIKRYQPKLVCLPNPDSPTGTVFLEEDLEKIISVCSNHGIIILIDEAYYPFCKITAIPLIKRYSNLVIARTFAKAWGLAGLRIGYAVGDNEVISFLHKVRPMYEINSVAVAVVKKMLEKYNDVLKSVHRLQEGMSFFLTKMKEMDFDVIEGAGNFSHVSFGERLEKINKKLNKDILFKKTFDHPSLKGYSRFSSVPKNQMKTIIELIK